MAFSVEEMVERAARNAYGRLVAYLARHSGDLASAEDAMGDALLAALRTWPERGVPEQPEAWLVAVAKNRLTDGARRRKVEFENLSRLPERGEVTDERLRLMFVCAHPSLSESVRTPLMLQAVLGLDAARIASAFVVSPAAMGQRLSRAKAKIRDAAIPFSLPSNEQFSSRFEFVLDAIYAAYGLGWDDVEGADPKRRGLSSEAIDLGRMLVGLAPEEPEALGLFALMLYCESRGAARRREGRYVPLSEQDVSLWSSSTIQEAKETLARASSLGRLGRFQLEAAIQSAHALRARTGSVDWKAIVVLYEGLLAVAPSLGAKMGYISAVSQAVGVLQAIELLGGVSMAEVNDYQPYWALAFLLFSLSGRTVEAEAARSKAIALSTSAATRAYLLQASPT